MQPAESSIPTLCKAEISTSGGTAKSRATNFRRLGNIFLNPRRKSSSKLVREEENYGNKRNCT